MRIVVTGCHGQLVQSLIERAGADVEIVKLGRPVLDLARSTDTIVAAVNSANPDIIVSAAAYTQVDKAESEPDLAFAVNEHGARSLAVAARNCGVPLIQVSTDYVFDGTKATFYVEEDETRPASVYGASKLAGEKAVLSENENSAVLRTAWVYSPFGSNFVKTMLRLGAQRDEVPVVADQRGNPTSALDIADGLLKVAANLVDSADPRLRGVFHMTAAGDASWAEFAERIFFASAAAGGPSAKVKRITSIDYPTAAARPNNSRLDCSKLAQVHDVCLPHWRRSITTNVERLLKSAS